jgi:transcription antitermination factor NusG
VSVEKKWYVVYTKPRWEKKVAASLLAMGVENYCPLNRVHKQWSDRVKVVKEPLFKGYVFLSPTVEMDKWDIKKVEGIINYVHWLGKPALVKEKEIQIIQKFLNEFDDVTVENEQIKKNERVVIKKGLMMNYKGLVLEIIDNKARVQIESMGLALTAIFERKNLMKIG